MWHLLLDVTMLGHNGDGPGCGSGVRVQQRMFVHIALATMKLGEQRTCRASTAFEEVFAAIRVRDYNGCGRHMIPHETVHGPGDTIVITLFARSLVTQVLGKWFLRGKSAPEILVHCRLLCLRTPKKHDQEEVKSCGEFSLPFRFFFFSEWYSNTVFRWRRSGDIHTRSRGAEEERRRQCADLGGAECVAEVFRTKVTWHCALVLVADALRMDLRTGVAAWSRPEDHMRRVASETCGTCVLGDGVHVSVVASFLAELWDTHETKPTRCFLCSILLVLKLCWTKECGSSWRHLSLRTSVPADVEDRGIILSGGVMDKEHWSM